MTCVGYNPQRVAGKLRFVEEDASDEFRLLAVMSMLSIVERSRFVLSPWEKVSFLLIY